MVNRTELVGGRPPRTPSPLLGRMVAVITPSSMTAPEGVIRVDDYSFANDERQPKVD